MPSEWVKHVQSVYKSKKAKNASYSYKQAMKDAKATYKRKAGGKKAAKTEEEVDEKAPEAPKKRRRRKKKAQ